MKEYKSSKARFNSILLIVLLVAIALIAIRMVIAETQLKQAQTQQQIAPKQTIARLKSQFPRPHYDSGWISFRTRKRQTIRHNIGGNVENYFVDMLFRDEDSRAGEGGGINVITFGGGYHEGSPVVSHKGAYWWDLTNESLQVGVRGDSVDSVRIRIWVYD
jgi:NADH:ubiquinone oxidoreductase subunit 3 (subunit A)